MRGLRRHRTCAAPARGELVVHVEVETPTRLDAEQEDLLRELAALRGEDGPAARSRPSSTASSTGCATPSTSAERLRERAGVLRAPPRGCVGRPACCSTAPEGRHAATVRRLGAGEHVVLADGAAARGAVRVAAVRQGPPRGRRRRRDRRTGARAAAGRGAGAAQGGPRRAGGRDADRGGRRRDRAVGRGAVRDAVAGERGEKALARWRTTAREAAKQSRRARFPVVAELAATRDVAALLRGAALACCCTRRPSSRWRPSRPPDAGEIVVVVGPEGGISHEELAVFTAAGATAYRLDRPVLRTSTAGTAAAAACCPAPPAGADRPLLHREHLGVDVDRGAVLGRGLEGADLVGARVELDRVGELAELAVAPPWVVPSATLTPPLVTSQLIVPSNAVP